MAFKWPNITEGLTKATKAFFEEIKSALSEVETETLEEKLTVGYLSAKDHGVTTSGDQTTAISTFFDLCHSEGKNAYFPKGVYTCGKIIKAYGLNIIADPGAEISTASGTSGELWTFEGSFGTAAELGIEALKGTRVLEGLTAATRVKGEVLSIGTVTQVPNNGGAGGGTRFCGQLVEISNVVSTTKVELRERLYRTFTAHSGADKTTVTPVNVIKGMEVAGLKFINPTEANARFLLVQLARDVDIDIESDTPLQPAVEVQNVYGFRITSRSEHGQHDNSTKFGYATFASAGSCHGQVNSVCANGNYAFNASGVNSVPGEPYDITITGICDNSNRNGWGTHPEGHHILFTGATALNCAESGFGISGPNVTVQSCTVTGSAKHGVEATTNAVKSLRVVGSLFIECEEVGVYVNNTNAMEDITIAENTFESIGHVGILTTGPITRLRQHGNGYTKIGTISEGYVWRHEKAITSGIVSDEQVDATGANQKISRFEVAATSTVLARCIIKHASSATKWGFDSGGEEPKNGVESGGVFYEANLVATT